MKRSAPPRRRTPLKRGKPPTRKARLRAITKDARKKLMRFERQFGSEERVDWMQAQHCCICGTRPVDCHHVKTRGAGGTADDMVPLCRTCHQIWHSRGRAWFENEFDIDAGVLAQRYTRWWREHQKQEGARHEHDTAATPKEGWRDAR